MSCRSFRPDIADGAMLAVVLMWAVNNVVTKLTVAVLPPPALVFGRFVIVIALVWVWIGWRRIPARIARHDLPLLLLVSLTGFGIFNALFTVGVERTSAFSSALLVSLGPIFTLVLARVIGIEHPTTRQWLATGLALLGVLVFVGDKLHVGGFSVAASGDLLTVGAACLFGIYSLAVRPLTDRYGATVTTGWAVLIGLIAVGPWSASVVVTVPWGELSPSVWAALIYTGAVAMLIGYTLWSWAVTHGGVARTAPYLFLVPVATGIISALALGETFGPLKIVGAVMVLTGTTLARLLGRPLDRPETETALPAPPRVVVARGGD